ncbi:hypothetical protein O1611_g7466 [Lasiodiplodia mahajangana]|uniref:Uncharacterized protein n=1 Tax=Lasiodiplodia mahajangana TaxID=1108764 RepID=A0ACC2JF98_9PEZI|nr:hypothetical protein O1611_g7466 [Lasiodiplodia mahajangana]
MAGVRYDNLVGLILGTVILQVLAALCVGLRFYTKRWKRQKIITSDWLVTVAFIFGAGLTALELYGEGMLYTHVAAISSHALAYPTGASIEDPKSVTDRVNRAKYVEFSFLILGIIGLGFLKLSVCFLYWNLFAKLMFRRFLIFWTVIITLWTVTFSIIHFAECGDHLLALFAQIKDYTKYCKVSIHSGWAYVGTDILTDVITLIIPIPVILRLNMSRQMKVLSLLCRELAEETNSSVGASTVEAYIYISSTLSRYTEDAILILTGFSIWNLAEIQIGIIAACGPALRAVAIKLLRFLSKIRGCGLYNHEINDVGQMLRVPRRDGTSINDSPHPAPRTPRLQTSSGFSSTYTTAFPASATHLIIIINLDMPPATTTPPAEPRGTLDYTTSEAGNPFVDGWYADPGSAIYDGVFWVYSTSSRVPGEQTYIDAFSSPDLINWTKHLSVLTIANVAWATKALGTPTPISRNGKYYLYFSANNIQEDEIGAVGGIGVAVANKPDGPFVDAIGKPLIGKYHNDAQPIDPDVFVDDADGRAYIYYGGHSHANIVVLNEDMISLGTFEDGAIFKEITPKNYANGPRMHKQGFGTRQRSSDRNGA